MKEKQHSRQTTCAQKFKCRRDLVLFRNSKYFCVVGAPQSHREVPQRPEPMTAGIEILQDDFRCGGEEKDCDLDATVHCERGAVLSRLVGHGNGEKTGWTE